MKSASGEVRRRLSRVSMTRPSVRAFLSIVWPSAGPEYGTCLDAINQLRRIYSGPIGYDFDHIQEFGERAWLHTVVEAGTFRTPFSRDQERALLKRLTEVEGFERRPAHDNPARASAAIGSLMLTLADLC